MRTPLTFFEDNVLTCPICEGVHLHQTTVAVYHLPPNSHRGEEGQVLVDTSTREVRIGNVDRRDGLNPSYTGREGLRIKFMCEEGCKTPDLLIWQHKGWTHVEWDEVSMLPDGRFDFDGWVDQ